MRSFAGRSVVITGAGGGLGAALVQAFLSVGAKVAALDRDAQALQALAAACAPSLRGNASALQIFN